MSLTAPALLSYTFVPLNGPYAEAGAAHVRRLWHRIREEFGFDAPIEGLHVPAELPPSDTALSSGGTRLLAACERQDDEVWQASVRVEHDVVCLTLMMAPPRLGDVAAVWRESERLLDEIGTDPGAKHVIGESRLFLGLGDDDWDETAALVHAAAPPPAGMGWSRRSDRLTADDGTGRTTVWELGASSDERSLRRLVLVAPTRQERALDRLVWTSGDGELAPFARYLLHAAKLRYQIRVFHNGRVCERTRGRLYDIEDEMFWADGPQLMARDRLDRAHRTADIVHTRLTRMRRGVDVIVDNLRNALHVCRPEGSAGPISDDLGLVDWFIARLDDEAEQLAEACARARSILDRGERTAPAGRDLAPPVEPAHGDQPPLVFISYIHDSPEHKNDVLRFAHFLRHNGIDAQIDRWIATRQDWYQWVLDLIPRSDFVIVIASPMCQKVGDGQIPGDLNLGGQSEMTLLRELLQSDRPKWTSKLLPVVLPGHDWRTEIPRFLQASTADHYPVKDFTVGGAEYLLRTITGQHPNPPPPLGPRVLFPPALD